MKLEEGALRIISPGVQGRPGEPLGSLMAPGLPVAVTSPRLPRAAPSPAMWLLLVQC